MLNLKNTNILILNIGGYVNLPFSDKKNINSKYTWAEDTWGSLDPKTGQWNGLVQKVK